jgi:hypothetical protein
MADETTIQEAKDRFLAAFVERRGDVEEARKDAGLTKAVFYRWLQEDEVFRARFDQYRLALAEEVEGEAFRRVLNPTKTRGTDALVATLLKGLKKERYGDTDAKVGAAQIVYISGLRELPRPGVRAALGDGSGPVGADQPGAGVPDAAGPEAGQD